MGYRMGCHVIHSTPEAMTFSRVAPVVKSLDNVDVLKAARPEALRIFRHYFATQDLTTPRDAANAIIASLQGYRHPNLVVSLYNEIGQADRDKYVWFCLTAVPLLQMAGLKVCGPSWGTGDFEQADWDAFRKMGWAGLNFIDLHAYWGDQGLSVWNALRYRTYWRPGDPEVIVSECGRDKVEGGHGGWQKDGITAAQYVDELVAYAHETAKDSYVVGVTPYSCGPSNDWTSFTIDPLVTDLIKQLGYGENVVNIGPGMKKAIPFLGQPIEDQAYHFAGSDHEVGVAVFEFGYATWAKRDNETWAHCNDGRSWRDFGNASKDGGALHQVTNPFP